MNQPRYATLHDYVRVVKRSRLLITMVAVVFAGAALAFSLTQKKTYTASSTLELRDVVQDLNLIGGRASPVSAPGQLAAVNSKLVESPAVAERVKRDLGTDLSVASLQEAVTTSVGSQSNLVTLSADAGTPEFAAKLANSFARQTRLVGRQQTQKQLTETINSIRERGQGVPNFEVTYLGQLLSQFETARTIAEPVRIVASAGVPSAPSSPKLVRNTLLGLLVGLTLGLVAAFARDSLDRRLRGSQEVSDELGLPVLAKVSESALGHIGFGVNGSAPVPDPDLESFRILRTNLEFLRQDRPLRSFLVTSGLPEEGKSTVAASLGCAAALAGRRTLLVECDVRRPSLATRLGIEPRPGLTDYLIGTASPQDVLQTVDLREPMSPGNGAGGVDGPGSGEPEEATIESAGPTAGTVLTPGQKVGTLVCIAAGSNASHPAELLGSDRFRDFLEKVTKAYEVVVIDSSPLLSVVDPLELASRVDSVLVCVRVSQTTREQARAVRTALERIPERPMGAVLTGLRPEDDDAYGYYYSSYGS